MVSNCTHSPSSIKLGTEMEMYEIEAIMEKICDIHDKLSDAIHSISRIQFLNSIQTLTKNPEKTKKPPMFNDLVFVDDDDQRSGFVFVKDFRVQEDHVDEAKSLNAIRTAVENLEYQLEFLHTVQLQQQSERDAAIARLEQSRICLAMRLAEHHGNKYKVIDEALAFVGGVHDDNRFASPEKPHNRSGDNVASREGEKSNILMKILLSSLNFAKKSLKMDHNMGGIIGNAALVAISMLAFLHLHQVGYKGNIDLRENKNINRNVKMTARLGASSHGSLKQLDVMMARG